MSPLPPPPDFAGIEKRTKTERDNLLLLNKSKQRFLFLVFGFTAVYNQEQADNLFTKQGNSSNSRFIIKTGL